MNFEYTQEQIAIQDSLKRFISKDYTFEKRMGLVNTQLGYSKEAWETFAELGLLALPIDEKYDGLSGNSVDTMLIMEVLGKGLSLEPYLSSIVIGASLINGFGKEKLKNDLLPKIAQGELKIAFAHYEPNNRYEVNQVELTAQRNGEKWLLNGNKSVVLNAGSSDYLLVTARTSGEFNSTEGITVFLIPTKSSGIKLTAYNLQDGSKAADLQFVDTEISEDCIIGEIGKGIVPLQKGIDLANSALCSEAVGIMAALNEITLEYLKTRKQFGVPIGKFQALQHRMADMVLATEQSKSMAILAATSHDIDNDQRSLNISMAKAYICEASRLVGQEAIQLHGGMGVTNELNTGHYFKRLTAITLLFGDYDYHMNVVSNSLLNNSIS